MKFRIALLGVLFGLGTLVQGQTTSPNAKTTQTANRMKQASPTGQRSLTGCVDQQDGHYVMRDNQTSQILSLQSPGSDDDTWFARFVGHQAQVSGTQTSGNLKVAHIEQVADMCGTGK
jgi:hypothetical protein